MVDQAKLQDLIKRIERMRGRTLADGSKITYLGDGVNDHITSVELLEFLRVLQTRQKLIDESGQIMHNCGNATEG